MIKDLITNKDLKAIQQKATKGNITADEANILQYANWSEFQIQSACYTAFKNAGFGDSAIFVQIDNGGSAIEGIRKKKAATGTQAGFPDIIINLWVTRKDQRSQFNYIDIKSFYIEFKKINGKIAEKQQKWHDFLKAKCESVYFCNNLLFFERLILKEIREFLNDK